MNQTVTMQDVRELLDLQDGPCLSLYTPLDGTPAGNDGDRIRMKNLLAESEKKLEEEGEEEPGKWLEPLKKTVADFLWDRRAEGAAFFVSEKGTRSFALAKNPELSCALDDVFRIKPLLRTAQANAGFYVLALSQNRPRLFLGSLGGVRELEFQGPKGIDHALAWDDPEKQLQFHTEAAGQGGARNAVFHGQGVSHDDEKERLEQYFRIIDKAVMEQVNDRSTPMILIGVDHLHPIYRRVSSHPAILEEAVEGSPDEMKPEEVLEECLPIMENLHDRKTSEAFAPFRERTAPITDDLEEALKASIQGQVARVMVPLEQAAFGTFDPSTAQVERVDDSGTDLFNILAVETLRKGGQAFVANSGDIPSDTGVAAILRF